MRIERLGPGDDASVLAAGDLFDHRPLPSATSDFLLRTDHYMFVAYDDTDAPVGFITGVVLVHPDKGREMFLYELGVAASHRRRGYARALIAALVETARAAGCYGMFVLTEDDNAAARAAYGASDARDEGPQRMYGWDL
jgi:ribosomal protein S18 acetylase RimI-like enzyme